MKLLRVLIAAVASLALVLPMASLANAAAPRESRQITEQLRNKPNSINFIIKVRDYANKRTYLQKANCKGCKFRDIQKKRTNDRGRVVYQLQAPNKGKWYFRVYTPKTVKFKKTYSRTAYTYRS